jgi:cobalt-zinc-cadmium efflux system outer membrane protein
MRPDRRTWFHVWGLAALLASGGCTSLNLPIHRPSRPEVITKAAREKLPSANKVEALLGEPITRVSHETSALCLEGLIDLAAQNHPDLAIAQARVEEARGRMIQAGLYPNPMLMGQLNELGHNENQWGEPGIGVSQRFVTAGKLQIARAAAAHGVQAADWQTTTRWFEVVTRVRQAYFELLTASQEEQTTRELVRVAQVSVDAAKKLLKGGFGSKLDVIRAEVELEEARIRLVTAERRVAASRRLLAAAVGVAEMPDAPADGSLHQPRPTFEWEALKHDVLARSSEVQEALARVLQAEGRFRRAQVEPIPDVTLQAMPFYSVPEQDTRVFLAANVNLPVFDRNQGNIHSAQAELAQAHAAVKKTELSLTERLATAYQRYQVARQQVEAYRTRILPSARDSLRLVRLAYEAGEQKTDYTTLLQTQQVLFEAELSYVRALGELWQAVAEIEGLLQVGPGGRCER